MNERANERTDEWNNAWMHVVAEGPNETCLGKRGGPLNRTTDALNRPR
jgi:hypothetical protein